MTRPFRSVAYAVAWRSIHNALINPAILVPSIVFPLFFLVAFAGGLSSVSKVPNFDYRPGYTAFQFVFVFIQSAAFGGVFTGFAIARDFEHGFARRLLLGAPARSGIIAGYAVAALVRWMITGAVVSAAALVAGMRFEGGPADVVALVGIAALVNLVAVLWAAGVAMLTRTEQAGSLIQMPVFLVLFLAPVYVPLPLLTGWVHAVAKVNPATAILEAGRGLVAGSPVKVGVSLTILAIAAAVLVLWARRGLRSAERAG
jgi:ABC-type multidrug transport system permease subunit